MRTSITPKGPLEAGSITEFLHHVQKICDRKGWFAGEDALGPWFRGQDKADWTLVPKLYRGRDVKHDAANNIEDEVREEFLKRAPVLVESLPAGNDRRAEWEWYFMMQHFGAATRLLDWSEGALIALYFAVKDNDGKDDAAVWVLDPYELNKQVIGKEWVIPPSAMGVKNDKYMRKVQKWLPPRFAGRRSLPLQTIAIDPTHVARRLSSQHSCFTIHGKHQRALDDLQSGKNSCLVKIVIRSTKAKIIKKDLRVCGITEATIFPDLDGLGRSINARWGI